MFTDPDDVAGEMVTSPPPSPGQPTFAPSENTRNMLMGGILRKNHLTGANDGSTWNLGFPQVKGMYRNLIMC